MENFLRRSGFEVPDPVRRFLQGDSDSWLRVEEYREGDTLVVRADVPGIDPEKDVDITVADDALHIEARREEKTEHKDKTGYRSDVRYGEFSRSIPLPQGVSQDGIGATYTDGVIEVRVRLPEKSGTSATKIRVSRSRSPAGDQSPEPPENHVR